MELCVRLTYQHRPTGRREPACEQSELSPAIIAMEDASLKVGSLHTNPSSGMGS